MSFGQNISTSSTPTSGNIYHNGGFLGIGTNTPAKKLEVKGSGNVSIRLNTRSESGSACKAVEDYIWDITNSQNLLFRSYFTTCGSPMPYETRMSLSLSGQLMLGGENPNNTAIIQINSTTRGILIPRMTTSEKTAISTPANGLMVYDTDTKSLSLFNITNGKWEHLIKQTELADYLLVNDFNNSIAGQLTDIDITNWNNAYSWGNHADVGYITDGNTNWENTYDFITASTNDELTNKTGNISMWNNDAGYLTDASITSPWQENYKNVYRTSGRVGIGTSTPKVSLHLFNFNKKGLPPEYPALRFELHGSSNISPNHTVWDIKSMGTVLGFQYSEVKADGRTTLTTKLSISNKGVVTAARFVGDGSGLTNLNMGGWANNGNNTYYNQGKVGIGTDIPSTQLEINNGSIKISGGTSLDQGARFQIDVEGSYGHKYLAFRNNRDGEVFGVWGDGTVRATKIKVQSSWADFVFNANYELPPLYKVEEYITVNKHLPNIPTENEILEQGLDLGEMQKLQMQKIEELTLYIIAQQKEIDKLKIEVEKLK